jgi:hypothetical protein
MGPPIYKREHFEILFHESRNELLFWSLTIQINYFELDIFASDTFVDELPPQKISLLINN